MRSSSTVTVKRGRSPGARNHSLLPPHPTTSATGRGRAFTCSNEKVLGRAQGHGGLRLSQKNRLIVRLVPRPPKPVEQPCCLIPWRARQNHLEEAPKSLVLTGAINSPIPVAGKQSLTHVVAGIVSHRIFHDGTGQ